MNIICLISELYNPNDNEFAKKDTLENIKFVFMKDIDIHNISEYDSYSIMLPDGMIYPVNSDIPISSVFSQENIEKMTSFILEKMKNSISDMASYLKNKRLERESVMRELEQHPEKKTEYLQYSMQITSIYTITDHKIDELKEDKNVEQEIFDSIISERKKEEEEKEEEIQNELDMLNTIIKQTFPDTCDKISIESCTYNGKEIDSSEMINKLSSHMLPNFITQIDIRETLDDEYRIITNLGIIIREKGGEIRIVEN